MAQTEWIYKEINTILQEDKKQRGSKIYIESPDQAKNITFAQAHDICNKIANYLKQKGIKATDKIALIGENSVESIVIYVGILNYGALPVLMNSEESKENIYRILNLAKPVMVLFDNKLTFEQEKYQPASWVSFSGDYTGGSGKADDLFTMIKGNSPDFTTPVGNKDDIAQVLFTSGTTELPKGVVTTRESFFFENLETVERLPITDQDTILEYRAFNWGSVQGLSILSSLYTGATLVFARKFSRSKWPTWLKDYKVTIAVGVPTVINILLAEPVAITMKDVPHLRFMTSSSAALSPKNLVEFEKVYGIPINQMGGMSEAGWIGLNDPAELKDPSKRKIGSLGKVAKRKEVLILDESGNKCKPGEEGELIVKGIATALGYLQPDGTITKFNPPHEIHTGDLGYIDKDGYVYITGRKKDLIIRGGVNISPLEITDWLLQNPDVQEAATIGVPDAVRGEEVACFVVPKAGKKLDETIIIAHCKKKLPDFKLPKTVDFVTEIPKTARQKVAKADLLKIWNEKHQK
jgi:long-chain acyl-CoA synthetase